VIFALVGFALAVSPPQNNGKLRKVFNNWKAEHGRIYETAEEEELRFATWLKNLNLIREHNKKTDVTYKMGLNAYSDLSSEEFRKRMNGLKVTPEVISNWNTSRTLFTATEGFTNPTSVDWRTEGVVTGVKNQGQCGGCWSFSATGSIEGQWALAGNTLTGLSEQNLLDCSTNGGNDGCNGGLMTDAFTYVINNDGIDTEASYPYQAEGPLRCRYEADDKGATISSFKNIPSGSEAALESAAATIGPISVAIDASLNSFQNYRSGIYYEARCSSSNLDHGVLVVGYGTENGQDYWIVKNSWGTTWGIQGYIWMAKDENNNCGIATMASYPLVN